MYDAGKIVPGLVLFAGLATLPVWMGLASGAKGEKPPLAAAKKDAGPCVLPAAEMRAEHMQLLNDWRQRVVRTGTYETLTADGRQVRMSLTQTCLGCHDQKVEFCDRCHDWAAVTLTCFDCHLVPGRSR